MDGAKTKTEHQPLDKYGIQLLDPDYDPFSDFMALGDGYMDAKWQSDDIALTLLELTRSRDIVRLVKDKRFNRNASAQFNYQNTFPTQVVDEHYDRHEQVILSMLGDCYRLYTCADWRGGAQTITQAQAHKVERINQKLELEDDMSVLDLGCGWGGYADATKLNYDVHITGYNLSESAAGMAEIYCDTVIVGDYGDAVGQFDRVISLGLLEHVGPQNYRRYMKTVYSCLKPDGISLFQTIGYNKKQFDAHPWIDQRIFPNGVLPSFTQLSEAMEGLFVLEDVENMGMQYATTVEHWLNNFRSAVHSGALRVHPRFYRMWEFYLCFFRAAFLTREYQLWQVVMTKRRPKQAVRI